MRALRRLGLVSPGDQVSLSPLTGGVSSEIFKVEIGERIFVVKCALAKLRVAADWQAPRSRNRHEADWFETVAQILPDAVPRILARDDEAGLFVMEYFDPVSYPLWKGLLRDGQVDVEFAAEVGRRLAWIHAATALNAEIADRFATDSIFHAIRLEPYLETAARCHPEVCGSFDDAVTADSCAKNRAGAWRYQSEKHSCGTAWPGVSGCRMRLVRRPGIRSRLLSESSFVEVRMEPRGRAAVPGRVRKLAEAYLDACDWETRAGLEVRAGHLLAALFLARVDGKSPVEYITAQADRELVRQTALPLIAAGVDSPFAVQRAWAANAGALNYGNGHPHAYTAGVCGIPAAGPP